MFRSMAGFSKDNSMGIGRARLGWVARVVACVLVAGGLAGCGTAKTAGDSSSGKSPLQLVRASYGATVHAHTARFSMAMNVSGMTVHGTGATQFQPRQTTMTMQAPQMGGSLQMRMVDRRLYMKLPQGMGVPLPAGKSWLMLDLSKAAGNPLAKSLSLMTGGGPDQSLGYLKSLNSVTRKGKATVRGVPATHYRAVIDLKKLMTGNKLMKSGAQRMMQSTGKSTFATDVYLDQQGRVVRQQFTTPITNPQTGAKMAMKMQMDMFGFGKPVHVTAPSPQQTMDMARMMSAQG
jgi:hypothetical protein